MHPNRILLVEDNYILSQDLQEWLEGLGHVVKAMHCGQAAFSAIGRHEDFTGLVTDVDLGGGPDGVDVARYARAFHPRLPVVFMSAGPSARCTNNGVARSEFVAKPFRNSQISDALARVILLEAA